MGTVILSYTLVHDTVFAATLGRNKRAWSLYFVSAFAPQKRIEKFFSPWGNVRKVPVRFLCLQIEMFKWLLAYTVSVWKARRENIHLHHISGFFLPIVFCVLNGSIWWKNPNTDSNFGSYILSDRFPALNERHWSKGQFLQQKPRTFLQKTLFTCSKPVRTCSADNCP